MPFAFWKALTHGTLVVEGAAPFLLLFPVYRSWTRAIAIFTLLGLHIGTGVRWTKLAKRDWESYLAARRTG